MNVYEDYALSRVSQDRTQKNDQNCSNMDTITPILFINKDDKMYQDKRYKTKIAQLGLAEMNL